MAERFTLVENKVSKLQSDVEEIKGSVGNLVQVLERIHNTYSSAIGKEPNYPQATFVNPAFTSDPTDIANKSGVIVQSSSKEDGKHNNIFIFPLKRYYVNLNFCKISFNFKGN